MTHVRDTSLEAYQHIQDVLGPMEIKVYDAIKKMSIHEYPTDREIAWFMGYRDPNKTRPRRRELVKMGWVCEASKRVCRITGRTVYTWRPTK